MDGFLGCLPVMISLVGSQSEIGVVQMVNSHITIFSTTSEAATIGTPWECVDWTEMSHDASELLLNAFVRTLSYWEQTLREFCQKETS